MKDIKKENINIQETDNVIIKENIKQPQFLKKDIAISIYESIKNNDISLTETTNTSIKENILIPYEIENIFSSIHSRLTFQEYETWKTNILAAIIRRNSNIYKNIFPEEVLNINYINQSMNDTITSSNDIRQKNHGLSVGDFVYLDSDNRYKKAIAEDSIRSFVKGYVSKITGPNIFSLMNTGITNYNHLDYNDTTILYLSDKIPGKAVHYSEIKNTIYVPIAIYTENSIIINIQQGSVGDKLVPYDIEEQNFEIYTEQELNEIIQIFNNKVIS